MAHRASLTVPGRVEALSEVRDFVAQSLRAGGFAAHQLNRLQVAIDEAVTNIIEHGLQHCPAHCRDIHLHAQVSAAEFRIEIHDHGACFDPTRLADPDIAAHVRSGRDGGLGVFLMRRIMDQVDYHAEAGAPNRLVLIKRAA